MLFSIGLVELPCWLTTPAPNVSLNIALAPQFGVGQVLRRDNATLGRSPATRVDTSSKYPPLPEHLTYSLQSFSFGSPFPTNSWSRIASTKYLVSSLLLFSACNRSGATWPCTKAVQDVTGIITFLLSLQIIVTALPWQPDTGQFVEFLLGHLSLCVLAPRINLPRIPKTLGYIESATRP